MAAPPNCACAGSSVDRASASGAEGRRFESCPARQPRGTAQPAGPFSPAEPVTAATIGGSSTADLGARRTRPWRRNVKHLRLLAVLTATTLFVVACSTGGAGSPGADGSGEPAASEAAEVPEELVIGFVPSREADALVEDIQPLADYLTEALGIPVDGIVSSDYAGPRHRHGDRAGPDRRTAALRAGPGRRRAGAEIILQSERIGSRHLPHAVLHDRPGHVLRRRARSRTRASSRTRRSPSSTATARLARTTRRPRAGRARGAREPRAGHHRVIRRADLRIGLHLPGHGPDPAPGSTPRTDIEPLFAGGHDASVIAVCEGQAVVGVSFDDARTDRHDRLRRARRRSWSSPTVRRSRTTASPSPATCPDDLEAADQPRRCSTTRRPRRARRSSSRSTRSLRSPSRTSRRSRSSARRSTSSGTTG